MLHFAASDLGLHCLPKSNRKDARPIWVNDVIYGSEKLFLQPIK